MINSLINALNDTLSKKKCHDTISSEKLLNLKESVEKFKLNLNGHLRECVYSLLNNSFADNRKMALKVLMAMDVLDC